MPRIDAPTVAEHHARQRAALIAAARAALGEGGVAAVTPGAVARAAGLARTSVYQYFPSTDALVTAAIEGMFADAATQIGHALDGHSDPWSRVRAFVSVALRAAAGEFGPFHGFSAADLPETARVRLRELREELAAPLVESVAQLGVADPQRTTAVVAGAVGAGIGLIRGGSPTAATTDLVCGFVTGGLQELAAP